MRTLPYEVDPFNGVEVDLEGFPDDVSVFAGILHESLQVWQADGRRVAWLRIPIDLSRLIHPAVGAGFTFHHSGADYLMLTCTLSDDAFVPAYATHYIGAGGVVLDEQRRLLVVCERYHRNPGQPLRYKLPGGALQQGEHLADGVVREVLEETGVRTEFQALICFRHWHGYRYGKSDIYFVSRLRPLSHRVRCQKEEIADCRWMNVEEYLRDENASILNRRMVQAALDNPGLVTTRVEGYGDETRYEIFMPASDPPG